MWGGWFIPASRKKFARNFRPTGRDSKDVAFRTLLLALAAALGASAQPLSYSLLAAEGTKPGARFDGTIAYDRDGRRIFLFGGAGPGTLNDLWVYSLAQRRWTELRPEGELPRARFGHTLLFDPMRARLVLFGGQGSGFFSDTWSYDLAGNRWQRLAADGAGPSRRYGHSAVHDAARDRMIVSHGFTDAGRFDDTWAFDLANNTWRDVSPSSGRPLRRCLHHAVMDAASNQMLLYGGCASGFGPCPLGDLWSFDLTSNRWTEISTPARPPARDHYGATFDSTRNRMVLFGGSGSGLLNDTWEFDPRARTWRQAELAGAAPSPRSRHESAFGADRGVSFFFGGSTSAGETNELWMLGPGFALARPEISRNGVVNAFSGADGAVAPGEIVSLYGAGLGPLEGFATGIDPLTGRLPVSGPGVDVTFNGVRAPLYYVSAGQLNVQAPYELEGAVEASIVVTVNGSASGAVTVPVTPTKPGLFPTIFHADGSANSPDNPAAPGAIVILFATGQGLTSPPTQTGAFPSGGVFPEPAAPVSLSIGGRPAELLFRGQAPGTAGAMQINARIPEGIGAQAAAAVIVRIGIGESQAGVSVAIR